MSAVTKGRHRIVAKRQNSVAFLNLLAQAGLLSLKEVIIRQPSPMGELLLLRLPKAACANKSLCI